MRSALAVERGIISFLVQGSDYKRVCEKADDWCVHLHEAAIALGLVSPEAFFATLARFLNLPFVGGDHQSELECIRSLLPPYRTGVLRADVLHLVDGRGLLAPVGHALILLIETLQDQGGAVNIVLMAPPAYRALLYEVYAYDIACEARDHLCQTSPHLSAAKLTNRSYRVKLAKAGMIIGACLLLAPENSLYYGISALFLYLVFSRFLLPLFLRASCIKDYGHEKSDRGKITLLVPLFQESKVVSQLINALKGTRYPAPFYDVILLVEEKDHETRDAIKKVVLPYNFFVVLVPAIGPQTKPKALNIGLSLARGDYVGIYDAEDIPDADQLGKVMAAFAALPEDVACLQACLTIYNGRFSWLTSGFAAEYTLQFRYVLPLIARLGVPLPLGGTSNFFRVDVLRKVGGWDPCNVTEDADLGLRLERYGYRTLLINSSTREEAPRTMIDWIKQRTRWFKGWFQTLIVQFHNRADRPFSTNSLKIVQAYFLVFAMLSAALVHPFVCFGAFMIYVRQGLFGLPLSGEGAFLLFTLLLSYLIAAVALCYSALRMRTPVRLLNLFYIPVYWLLLSFSAYRALWQLITRPTYWEKTPHVGFDTAMK